MKLDNPFKCWCGTTVNYQHETYRITQLADVKAPFRFVSFEPLLSEINYDFDDFELQWIIIGAQTGKHPMQPKKEWVQRLIDRADKYNIPVFLKDNLIFFENVFH